MNHRKLHMDGQKRPPCWSHQFRRKWPKPGLGWFSGSKLLVYRHAAEKFGHMSFVCLKLILSGRKGEATHDGSSTYPIEHTFYGPTRHVNLGLVGNQQNEWSAVMYTFRRHLMFLEYILSEIYIKNYNLAWTSFMLLGPRHRGSLLS